MMLNLAVGGNWPGSPDSSTYFPSEMLVDYARAWTAVSCTSDCPAAGQKKCDGNGARTCELASGCLRWSAAIACGNGQVCEGGDCHAACVPKTCDNLGFSCGAAADGCGNTLNCGACGVGQACSNGICSAACADECSDSGARECSGESNYRVCGDYDSDNCLEWGVLSACGAGQICSGSGICSENCGQHCSKRCYDGDVYWYNCCGVREDVRDRCAAGETCAHGECVEENNCVPRNYKQCYDGDVYWYDSCGVQGTLRDQCADGQTCAQGECVKNNICDSSRENCDSAVAAPLTREKIIIEIAQIKQLLIELIRRLIDELQRQLMVATDG